MSSAKLTLFDLVPGKVLLDRYRLLRAHRESGMAATFEAQAESGGGRFELQVFPAGLFEDRDQAQEFADRLEAWRDLDTPIQPQLEDLQVLDDGSVIVVSDFPKGQSLRGWLGENARMTAPDSLALAKKLLGGLQVMHKAGLAHGDIKPQTIYFVPGGEDVMLVDGGVTSGLWAAKHLGTRTALIGTPYYAPIEQFGGDSPDDLTDLYNVATVVYEIVAGALPWSGKSFLEVFQSKMQQTPPSMSVRAPGIEVDGAFERAIVGGLAARREDRHQSADLFLAALEAVEL